MEEKEMSLKEWHDFCDEQHERLKNAPRLSKEELKYLTEALFRAENTPCIPFGGKVLTIAESIIMLTEYWQNLPPLPAEMMRNGE